MRYLALTDETIQNGSAVTVEAVIWGVVGILFIGAVVWAVVSRIRRERKEHYEDRDN